MDMPKIGEIKNLKDLSKVIVLPLLCACYIFQSQFTVQIDDWLLVSVNESAPYSIQIFQAIFIFFSKTIVSGFLFAFVYYLFSIANIYSNDILLPITVLVLLTLGFVGIFAIEKVALLKLVQPIWFYTTFVVAFFLLAHDDEMHS